MHFEDLSRYRYIPNVEKGCAYNIGWLDGEHPFPTGNVDWVFLDIINSLLLSRVMHTRGIHACNICDPEKIIEMKIRGNKILLGTAEIRVFSSSGKVYAAPDLLVHYILEHSYCPPGEFLKALQDGPLPPNEEYRKKIQIRGL